VSERYDIYARILENSMLPSEDTVDSETKYILEADGGSPRELAEIVRMIKQQPEILDNIC